MNNLRQFLSYRENCVECSKKLTFNFISNNNKRINFIEDHLRVELDINPFFGKTKTRFQVHLFLHMDSNNFHVEFLNSANQYLKFVPLSKIKDFQSFMHLKGIQIYNNCNDCLAAYNYSSSHLKLNYSKSTVNSIIINHEGYLIDPISDVRYQIYNNFINNESRITFFKSKENYITEQSDLVVPLVKITTKQEMIDKLKMLMTFS